MKVHYDEGACCLICRCSRDMGRRLILMFPLPHLTQSHTWLRCPTRFVEGVVWQAVISAPAGLGLPSTASMPDSRWGVAVKLRSRGAVCRRRRAVCWACPAVWG